MKMLVVSFRAPDLCSCNKNAPYHCFNNIFAGKEKIEQDQDGEEGVAEVYRPLKTDGSSDDDMWSSCKCQLKNMGIVISRLGRH